MHPRSVVSPEAVQRSAAAMVRGHASCGTVRWVTRREQECPRDLLSRSATRVTSNAPPTKSSRSAWVRNALGPLWRARGPDRHHRMPVTRHGGRPACLTRTRECLSLMCGESLPSAGSRAAFSRSVRQSGATIAQIPDLASLCRTRLRRSVTSTTRGVRVGMGPATRDRVWLMVHSRSISS